MLASPSLTTRCRAAALGILAAAPLLGATWGAQALDLPLPSVLGTSELFVADRRGALALGGIDPVAYFTEGASRFGRREYQASWQGLAWRFGSAANRSAFAGDPESFSPRLGGYDALMAARGILVEGDPATFRLAAGRLYLFRSEANRSAFDADASLVGAAERHWSALRAGLPQG